MKSVQFSEREKERRGVSGYGRCLWSIFGGGDVNESAGDKKRHLSLQLSQKGCLEKNKGSTVKE